MGVLYRAFFSWEDPAGGETKWGILYSTPVAVYGIVPQSALVGEVYGTAGGAYAEPQYGVGVRWEPSSTFVGAATWSHGFEGAKSGGVEIGVLIFSPLPVPRGVRVGLSRR